MDDHIRATPAANQIIDSRQELGMLLGVPETIISEIVADPNAFYTSFTIPKPNGEHRVIRPPRRRLRALQRTLLKQIYQRVEIRSCLHGGIPRRSIVTHARAHVGQFMVATLDIRKFFPSTSTRHLIPVISALGFVGQAASDLIELVILDGGLPQGAPTSSLLANLAFGSGDSRFIRICGRKRLRYSRFVDDLAISGDSDFSDLRGPFMDAIKMSGYEVAEEKIHFMLNGTRQVVTGLVVNDRIRPTREFISELKHEIRLCLDLGAARMADADGTTVHALQSRLTGRVAHVKHIDKPLGRRMQKMLYDVNWHSVRQQS